MTEKLHGFLDPLAFNLIPALSCPWILTDCSSLLVRRRPHNRFWQTTLPRHSPSFSPLIWPWRLPTCPSRVAWPSAVCADSTTPPLEDWWSSRGHIALCTCGRNAVEATPDRKVVSKPLSSKIATPCRKPLDNGDCPSALRFHARSHLNKQEKKAMKEREIKLVISRSGCEA